MNPAFKWSDHYGKRESERERLGDGWRGGRQRVWKWLDGAKCLGYGSDMAGRGTRKKKSKRVKEVGEGERKSL